MLVPVTCPDCGKEGYDETDDTVLFGVCPACFAARLASIHERVTSGELEPAGACDALVEMGIPAPVVAAAMLEALAIHAAQTLEREERRN